MGVIKIKKHAILAIISLSLLFTGCAQKENLKHTTRIVPGRYYTVGEVVTPDGNVWFYSQDFISEMESYDHQPVFVVFDDNGTPENIYDDIICGVMRDVETEIYDRLEAELSKSFTVERDGNIISVSKGN